MKRVIDILFAIVGLLVTAPLLMVIALLIKLGSSGQILYSSPMVGENGKIFSLFRFRTMTLGAERTLTRVGRFIRNYSLDHLPTLINLFKGDITIIGPRPMEIGVVDFENQAWKQYLQLKPGLFNYAVLKLGKLWTTNRVSEPALNQELEIQYRQQKTAILDFLLFMQFLWAYIASGGNVKARGKPYRELAGKSRDLFPQDPEGLE
jgi:lipopolysaccharide/colanic/teichoic acid biosynthesis glycosyltransferase